LTLYITPVVFYYMDKFQEKVKAGMDKHRNKV